MIRDLPDLSSRRVASSTCITFTHSPSLATNPTGMSSAMGIADAASSPYTQNHGPSNRHGKKKVHRILAPTSLSGNEAVQDAASVLCDACKNFLPD